MVQENSGINKTDKDIEEVNKKNLSTAYPSISENPVKKNTNKSPKTKNTYPSKVSTKKVNQHLIIGKHINSESGFSFACSESSSFREILVDFAKTVDISLNKTRSALFADVLANLTDKNDNIKMAFLLLEEMFGYKVLFISEVSNLYYGKDFVEKLKKRMNDTNEPLPF